MAEAKTSTWEVLLIEGLVVFAAGLWASNLSAVDDDVGGYGYMNGVTEGGASHTVLRPTTWAATSFSSDIISDKRCPFTIKGEPDPLMVIKVTMPL